MSRLAYVNGAFLRNQDALVHIEDRGFQFGDGVYEVCLHIDGALWDAKGHFARLRRSLAELEINLAITDRALATVFFEIVRRNRLRDALVYLQVTRGVAMRNHAFPKNDTPS
ncbi:MAG: aminotransferase class IV, partial [Pseudomonadota bacterium]